MKKQFKKGDIISSINGKILNAEVIDIKDSGVYIDSDNYRTQFCLNENIYLKRRPNKIYYFFTHIPFNNIKEFINRINILNYRIIHKEDNYEPY